MRKIRKIIGWRTEPGKSKKPDLVKQCQSLLFVSAFMFALTVFSIVAQGNSNTAFPLRVDSDWLVERLGKSSLVIVDARSGKEYQKLHIKGAVNIPVERTFNEPPNNHMVAPISRIQKIFGDAGITNDSWVVVYDGGGYVNAARIFWVLEVYGHKQVGILDGGIESWRASGYPVSSVDEVIQSGLFLPTVIPERLSTKLSTRLAIQNENQVLIDSRSPEEFAGKKSKTSRYGHIPSAVNIPSKMNYIKQGNISKLKPPSQLQILYGEIDKSKKVIAYCNRGRESALTYFILRELGYKVSTYDGSWMEWSLDQTLPVNKP